MGRTPKYAPGTTRREKRLVRSQDKLEKKGVVITKVKEMTDEELLADMVARFGMFRQMLKACIDGKIPSLIVPGAPGIGKTYNTEEVMVENKAIWVKVSGTITAIELFKLAFKYRFSGNVIVIDDGDKVFRNEDALNVLKAMTDSSQHRTLSWRSNSEFLEDVDQVFEYKGSVVFLSNINFQEFVDAGRGKNVEHMEALISRSLYLDLLVHNRRAISLWINYICTVGKMFEKEGVEVKVGTMLLKWLHKEQGHLREYSLRTVHKLCNLHKMGINWESAAKFTLCR